MNYPSYNDLLAANQALREQLNELTCVAAHKAHLLREIQAQKAKLPSDYETVGELVTRVTGL